MNPRKLRAMFGSLLFLSIMIALEICFLATLDFWLLPIMFMSGGYAVYFLCEYSDELNKEAEDWLKT